MNDKVSKILSVIMLVFVMGIVSATAQVRPTTTVNISNGKYKIQGTFTCIKDSDGDDDYTLNATVTDLTTNESIPNFLIEEFWGIAKLEGSDEQNGVELGGVIALLKTGRTVKQTGSNLKATSGYNEFLTVEEQKTYDVPETKKGLTLSVDGVIIGSVFIQD